MMDNGGGAALLYFAIIAVFIGTVVYPGIIATIIVLAIKLFKRKLTRRKLLILWVILFVLISLALRWVISPNFPTNREVLIKMPEQFTPRTF